MLLAKSLDLCGGGMVKGIKLPIGARPPAVVDASEDHHQQQPQDGELPEQRQGRLLRDGLTCTSFWCATTWRAPLTPCFSSRVFSRGPKIDGNRWNNRVVSNSGDWSGNVFDFWFKAYPMLSEGLPIPFRLSPDMQRVDDTPQHRAVREVLTNALVHATTSGAPVWSSCGSRSASSRPTQARSGLR